MTIIAGCSLCIKETTSLFYDSLIYSALLVQVPFHDSLVTLRRAKGTAVANYRITVPGKL